jgi:hypothetical protein
MVKAYKVVATAMTQYTVQTVAKNSIRDDSFYSSIRLIKFLAVVSHGKKKADPHQAGTFHNTLLMSSVWR